MRVLDHDHGQPSERITERRGTRYDRDDGFETGIEETARGFPDE